MNPEVGFPGLDWIAVLASEFGTFAVTVVGTGGAIFGTGAVWFYQSNGIAQQGNAWNVKRAELLKGVGGMPLGPVYAPTPEPNPDDDPDPDDDEEKQTVNLDTGAMIGATQLRDPYLRIGLHMLMVDKNLVATRAALNEFTIDVLNFAGPRERRNVQIFFYASKTNR